MILYEVLKEVPIRSIYESVIEERYLKLLKSGIFFQWVCTLQAKRKFTETLVAYIIGGWITTLIFVPPILSCCPDN